MILLANEIITSSLYTCSLSTVSSFLFFFAPAADENLLSFLTFSWSVKWEEEEEETSHFPICPSWFSVLQNKAPIIWVWAVVVKNKCWWSSDVYNSIQVLYGHIIKKTFVLIGVHLNSSWQMAC